MIEQRLLRLYELAQTELDLTPTKPALAVESKDVYLELPKEIAFANLPLHIKELIQMTEPTISPQAIVGVTFTHFNAFHSPGMKQLQPESYGFSIRWIRPGLPDQTPAAVDAIRFSITVTENGLLYRTEAGSGVSNMRSNRSREDILRGAVRNGRKGSAERLTEYQEIMAMLALREFQDELLEELLGIFLVA